MEPEDHGAAIEFLFGLKDLRKNRWKGHLSCLTPEIVPMSPALAVYANILPGRKTNICPLLDNPGRNLLSRPATPSWVSCSTFGSSNAGSVCLEIHARRQLRCPPLRLPSHWTGSRRLAPRLVRRDYVRRFLFSNYADEEREVRFQTCFGTHDIRLQAELGGMSVPPNF